MGIAATLFLASGGLLAGYYVLASKSAVTPAEAAHRESGTPAGALEAAVGELLARNVTVRIGNETITTPWRELGVVLDEKGLALASRRADPTNVSASLAAQGALPVIVDRERAAAALQALKGRYDQDPLDARMDLENRTIHPSRDGMSLDIYGSLGGLESGARSGAEEVLLVTIPVPATVTVRELGIEDISHVLAEFQTNFAVVDRDRNYNLKLAASKLDGYVLQPGVEFSFNDVVGARTEKEGYKVAHVIQAGEMIDGLAGGTCQISTTLHGAAFFAGLDIVKSTPHSRPSTYVTMGLDSTVVYPSVDLKLKNSYDFPVVIHYKVSRGSSVVEILGKERPYDKVVFEREVVEKLDFDMVTREDDTMPVGSMVVDQHGFYGYKIERLRKFYKGNKVVKRDKSLLRYAPVTEYVRTGINPDPNLAPPKQAKDSHRLKEPGTGVFKLAQ